MTDDIVTRLRESAEFWSGTEYGADFAECAEAADEIERLRDALIECESIISRLKIELAVRDGVIK